MAKSQETSNPSSDLINALVEAIKITKPKEKKTAADRQPQNAWTPKDGSKKLKLRRKMYQHGVLIDPDLITNEEIDLLNKLKPGRYLEDNVKVYKRKDQGINIEYPVKTPAQRMRFVSRFSVTNFKSLLEKLIEEGKHPKPEISDDNE